MGRYLNSIVPLESCRSAGKGRYFVDKSELLSELIPAIDTSERFFCITRPRRFGKSTMANMIGAFFGKAEDRGDIFDQLSISKSKDYRQHRNKHNVIFIDFSGVPEKCSSYDMYIIRILDGLKMDLCRAYHDFGLNPCDDIWDILV